MKQLFFLVCLMYSIPTIPMDGEHSPTTPSTPITRSSSAQSLRRAFFSQSGSHIVVQITENKEDATYYQMDDDGCTENDPTVSCLVGTLLCCYGAVGIGIMAALILGR